MNSPTIGKNDKFEFDLSAEMRQMYYNLLFSTTATAISSTIPHHHFFLLKQLSNARWLHKMDIQSMTKHHSKRKVTVYGCETCLTIYKNYSTFVQQQQQQPQFILYCNNNVRALIDRSRYLQGRQDMGSAITRTRSTRSYLQYSTSAAL